MSANFETGATVGTASWHGTEKLLAEAPKSVEEFIRQGGLDWTVSKHSLFVDDGNHDGRVDPTEAFRPIYTHEAVRRDCDGRVLAVVGKGFEPIQNATAFSVAQPLVDAGLITLDTVGSLAGGRRVYLSGKINGERAEVVPGDEVRGSMLIYNGHDGSLKYGFKHTPIRVVCQNTLTAAAAGDSEHGQGYSANGVFFFHRAGATGRVEDLRERIEYMAASFDRSVDAYRSMTRSQLDPKQFFLDLLGIPEKRLRERSVDGADQEGLRTFDQLLEAYEIQPGREFAAGTAWTAYNAVTYHVDHVRGRSDDSRMNASMFGTGATLRDRAFQLVLAA